MFVSCPMVAGRETRSYNFGVFAYLFNSLFDLGRRRPRVFHAPTARPRHLYFQICLTPAPETNASGPPPNGARPAVGASS
jgi:hypothetical protein